MTSDFAPEVAKYPKSMLPPQQFQEYAVTGPLSGTPTPRCFQGKSARTAARL